MYSRLNIYIRRIWTSCFIIMCLNITYWIYIIIIQVWPIMITILNPISLYQIELYTNVSCLMPNWQFWWPSTCYSNKNDWKVIVISTITSQFKLGLVILALGIMLHHTKKHVWKLLKIKDPYVLFNIMSQEEQLSN